MVMSLWNLSQGLHFGFSTISLTKVWIKRTYKETRPGFSPRCASLFFVYSAPQRWVCVFFTVSYCLFLWTPLLSLTIEATVILPVVLVWSVEDQAAVCTVGLRRGTSLKRVRLMQQASNWQKASETKREIQCVNHIRSHMAHTKCKQFVNGQNMLYFFVLSSASCQRVQLQHLFNFSLVALKTLYSLCSDTVHRICLYVWWGCWVLSTTAWIFNLLKHSFCLELCCQRQSAQKIFLWQTLEKQNPSQPTNITFVAVVTRGSIGICLVQGHNGGINTDWIKL